MRKLFSLLLVVASTSAIVMAGPAKPVKKVACAVMHKKMVDISTATKNHMYSDYKGKRYYFCCAGCPETFKASPAKFKKYGHPIPKGMKMTHMAPKAMSEAKD